MNNLRAVKQVDYSPEGHDFGCLIKKISANIEVEYNEKLESL
jgi:hypothetical protein